jgi:uncharacterized membrane protein (DUF373 family)
MAASMYVKKPPVKSDESGPKSGISRLIEPWLARTDSLLYVIVAVLFAVAAVVMGGYSVWQFVKHLNDDIPSDVVLFVNDLLLVLIILEVLGTVRSYLATETTSLKPFLYIGIISATRRILAIGAQMTLGESPAENVFRHRMIDLGVNGAVVLALAVALYLFGKEVVITERSPHIQHPETEHHEPPAL